MSYRVSSVRPLTAPSVSSQSPLLRDRAMDDVARAIVRDEKASWVDRVVGPKERSNALHALQTVAAVTDFAHFKQDARVKALTKEHAGKWGFKVNTRLLLTFVWTGSYASQFSFTKLG